jgi:hypothetical protein
MAAPLLFADRNRFGQREIEDDRTTNFGEVS